MAWIHRHLFKALHSSCAVRNTHHTDSSGVRIRHASGIIKLWEDLLASPPTATTPSHAGSSAATDEQWRQAEALLKSQLRAFDGHTEGALLPEQVHQQLMSFYRGLAPNERAPFLLLLTSKLGLQEQEVSAAVRHWQQCMTASDSATDSVRHDEVKHAKKKDVMLKAAERLRVAAQPLYTQLFGPISREPDGIAFLVSLRAHVRDELAAQPSLTLLRALESHIKECLSSWFTPGLLTCQPLTWSSTPAALLDKLVQYEAVHPVRSLDDLRRRMGPDRRVHAYFHPCLPDEPLVILHAALMHHVPASLDDVLQQPVKSAWAQPHLHLNTGPSQPPFQTQQPQPSAGPTQPPFPPPQETASDSKAGAQQGVIDAGSTRVSASGAGTLTGSENNHSTSASGVGHVNSGPSTAVFYSISSTQPGLAGVDLGHFLIRDVAHKVQAELPSVRTLVTLSPVPGFRRWLQSQLAAQALQEADWIGSQQLSEELLLNNQQPVQGLSEQSQTNHKIAGSTGGASAGSSGTEQYSNGKLLVLRSDAGAVSGVTTGGWVAVKPNTFPLPPLITPSEGQQLLATAPQLLSQPELIKLSNAHSSPAACLALVLESGTWIRWQAPSHLQSFEHEFDVMLQGLLQRAAARYLLLERRRSLALDPVAHFHLRNGAQLLRINTRADLSQGGWQKSYGLMVNYLYLLEHADANNKSYLVDHDICAAASCAHLLLPPVGVWH